MSNADLSQMKSLTVDGVALKKLSVNGVIVWTAYKNWVPYSTEADGVTIYNGGLGYKNGYRVRSGGAEGASTYAACTGFIPCQPGQTIRVMDASGESISTASTNCAINFSDASRTNLGQIVGNSTGYGTCAGIGKLGDIVTFHSNNMWEYTVPSTIGDVAYVRLTVTIGNVGSTAANLIVTIDEEM